jgi:hypothetical protein
MNDTTSTNTTPDSNDTTISCDDDIIMLLEQQGALLDQTANALHGGPLPHGRRTWHDLPERAAAVTTELAAQRALSRQLATLVRQLPCRCTEGSDGSIDEQCDMCTAYFTWEDTTHV